MQSTITPRDQSTVKLKDQDMTATQGFESIDKNIIFVYPGDCPHCLKPFAGRGARGAMINVYTNHGKDQWCAECVEEGIKNNICLQESKLSKKEKKLWEKYIKKEFKNVY